MSKGCLLWMLAPKECWHRNMFPMTIERCHQSTTRQRLTNNPKHSCSLMPKYSGDTATLLGAPPLPGNTFFNPKIRTRKASRSSFDSPARDPSDPSDRASPFSTRRLSASTSSPTSLFMSPATLLRPSFVNNGSDNSTPLRLGVRNGSTSSDLLPENTALPDTKPSVNRSN